MFKSILFFIGLLLPALVRAQFVPGTYVLTNDPLKIYRGALQVSGAGLRVKDAAGQTARVAANLLVYAKTNDNRKFVPASGFRIPAGATYMTIESALVESLDSGRVCLLKYETKTAGVYSTDGAYESTGEISLYLARAAGAAGATALPPYAWTNGGAKLHAALRPYAASRPDLLALLEGKTVQDATLPAFFHALNSGQPFVKP